MTRIDEKLEKYIEKDKKAQERQYKKLLESEDVKKIKKWENSPPKTDKDIKKMMAEMLCFGSIAFCCSTPKMRGKTCMMQRDALLDIIGMSEEEYLEYKEECHNLFLKKYWKKKCANS